MQASSKLNQGIPATRTYAELLGARIVDTIEVLRELGAFAVITLGVTLTKFNVAKRVVHPLIFAQIWNAGVRLLLMVGFIGAAFGFLIVGQTVGLLTRVGAEGYIGTVMVTVIVRELGPLLTALIVLARAGTANVVELGTMRALGEVEALESLGVDPIHYLVMPRVIGLATSVFCLTTYLVLIAIVGGYVFAFLQNVPLTLTDYLTQLNNALRWEDFVLFALKTVLFGSIIAVVSCYHGLARPLRVEEISQVTARAVVESVTGCVLLDALFLLGYLFG
ncbi:MAG: ABC transporter permease [Verrucomicrobiia bacterium]|jgi:phospholipid/cholesterol/gamma-HCH transport system permease protein